MFHIFRKQHGWIYITKISYEEFKVRWYIFDNVAATSTTENAGSVGICLLLNMKYFYSK